MMLNGYATLWHWLIGWIYGKEECVWFKISCQNNKLRSIDSDYIYPISYKISKKANSSRRVCPYWKTISQPIGTLSKWRIHRRKYKFRIDDFDPKRNHIRAVWIERFKAEVKHPKDIEQLQYWETKQKKAESFDSTLVIRSFPVFLILNFLNILYCYGIIGSLYCFCFH